MIYKTPFYDWMIEKKQQIAWKWQGVPFPTVVHWHDNIDKHNLPWAVGRWNRSYLSMFIGSPLVQNNRAYKIRIAIINQCKNASISDCYVQGDVGNRNAFQLAGSSLLLYTNATFCFQPPGDAETRKGLYDAMLLGCIPVVFTPDVLSRVYRWHFTPEEGRSASVYIPYDFWTKPDDLFEILKKIPKDEILAKQKVIEKIAPRLQYAYPPQSAETWAPPFRDGLQIILDKLFDRIENFNITRIVPVEDRPNGRKFFDAIYGK